MFAASPLRFVDKLRRACVAATLEASFFAPVAGWTCFVYFCQLA